MSQTLDVSDSASVFHSFSADDVNRDPELRDLLRQGDISMDPAMRQENYAQALKLIAERAYVIPLYSQVVHYIANRDLQFKPRADGVPRLYEMSYR